jgi:hypothetical protein
MVSRIRVLVVEVNLETKESVRTKRREDGERRSFILTTTAPKGKTRRPQRY